jgi:arylsulfatase A-like enzyme
MRTGRFLLLVVLIFLPLVLTATDSESRIGWNRRRLPFCEPPARFYSSLHRQFIPPCCPLAVGMCPGGAACPASGICPTENVPCQPGQPVTRPNVIMILSDDQGDCHYGSAGECRSAQSGTPIPAPVTPNLDLLAGYSTTFPIAHNTAAWCYPSINSLLTARYARNFGYNRIADFHATIPTALRQLGYDPSLPRDPYAPEHSVIGGYCSFLGGKFTGSIGDNGFDAEAKSRRLGRTDCDDRDGDGAGPPLCGSDLEYDYEPRFVQGMDDLFEFIEQLYYEVPGSNPATFRVQPFYAWYAPRIPHQPLRAPLSIERYLFGSLGANGALGGVFNLGSFCTGGNCPPFVQAFSENNFGSEREFYASMWWVDDNLREIRKYLAEGGAPHCIGPSGLGSFRQRTPGACLGTWATIDPPLDRNTVLIYLTDNGWFLPDSKHHYTENGYRTRLMVFDPRNLPELPPLDALAAPHPPAQESDALAHAVDVLPTALGFALGTSEGVPCPTSPGNGTPCDGHDLRPYLFTAPGGPAAPEELRHSMCGHQTKRSRSPTRNRYLLTRPGSVGRCTNLAAPSCSSDAQCSATQFCLGGHCMPKNEPTCSNTAQCPAGALCLGGRCRPAPACVTDVGCGKIFPNGNYACVEAGTHWCQNAPHVMCGTRDDCPSCPMVNGRETPCRRLCEPRLLKAYIKGTDRGGKPNMQIADLFLDPDEVSLHLGPGGSLGTLLGDMSLEGGPYQATSETLNCCVDDWWPEVKQQIGTNCKTSCPANLTCNN